jgi:predicted transcriptional regulator YdeE
METTTKEKTPIQVVLDSLPKELQDINTISLLLEVEKKSRQNDLLKMMQKIYEHLNSSSENNISNFDFEKYIEENT